MKIYIALPISGRGYDAVVTEIFDKKRILEGHGYEVLQPMTAKGYLRNEKKFVAHGYGNPVSTNHAIVERDKWMVANSDVVFMDFSAATDVSIGCTMELAWGALLGKHTVIVLPETNPHRHAFILDSADIVFETSEEAIGYLKLLISGKMQDDIVPEEYYYDCP